MAYIHLGSTLLWTSYIRSEGQSLNQRVKGDTKRETVSLLESGELRYIKAINNNKTSPAISLIIIMYRFVC